LRVFIFCVFRFVCLMSTKVYSLEAIRKVAWLVLMGQYVYH
jgi:hypothetical protein